MIVQCFDTPVGVRILVEVLKKYLFRSLYTKQKTHPIGWVFILFEGIQWDSNAVKKQHGVLFLNGDRRFLRNISL